MGQIKKTKIKNQGKYKKNGNIKKNGKKYGLATQCIGLGQGIATILENIN